MTKDFIEVKAEDVNIYKGGYRYDMTLDGGKYDYADVHEEVEWMKLRKPYDKFMIIGDDTLGNILEGCPTDTVVFFNRDGTVQVAVPLGDNEEGNPIFALYEYEYDIRLSIGLQI